METPSTDKPGRWDGHRPPIATIERKATEVVAKLATRAKSDSAKLPVPSEAWVRVKLQEWALGTQENTEADKTA